MIFNKFTYQNNNLSPLIGNNKQNLRCQTRNIFIIALKNTSHRLSKSLLIHTYYIHFGMLINPYKPIQITLQVFSGNPIKSPEKAL